MCVLDCVVQVQGTASMHSRGDTSQAQQQLMEQCVEMVSCDVLLAWGQCTPNEASGGTAHPGVCHVLFHSHKDPADAGASIKHQQSRHLCLGTSPMQGPTHCKLSVLADSHWDTNLKPGMQAATTHQSCRALHRRLPRTEQQGKAPHSTASKQAPLAMWRTQMHPVMEGATPSMLVARGWMGASSTWKA